MNAEQYLQEILEKNQEIRKLQKEINTLVVESRKSEGFEEYVDCIETYYESWANENV